MENAEPDWLTAHREKHPEDFEPRLSRRGGFRPGVSGNPAGRPKGSKNRKTQLHMFMTTTAMWLLAVQSLELIWAQQCSS